MIKDYHVRIETRDGTSLSADIYRPERSTPCTAVLVRTCYTKTGGPHPQRGQFWATHGYAYIVQDVRGRGDSEGTFYPIVHECEDGSDTINWIASQPWSDGRVVMSGGSYLGWTQMYAACSGNPHLKALAPMTTPANPDSGFPMYRGMILPAAASWMATLDGHINQELDTADLELAFRHRPIVDFDKILGRYLRPWRDWIDHSIRNESYWDKQDYQQRIIRCPVPMLHVSGWYDDCLNGALENFTALTTRNGEDEVPAQRLLIGPWLHSTVGQRINGGIDFGAEAEIDINRLQLEWFDAILSNVPQPSARVRLFVMGRDSWISEQEWPIARTMYVPYYLRSGGNANSRNGDGELSVHCPTAEPTDRFLYDPNDPVDYCDGFDWKQIGGPDDCGSKELRIDILVYTTAVLSEALLICGPLRVRLFAATSARDTDWMAKILNVYPDGRSIRLTDGAVRARFRHGHGREVFLCAGAVEEYDIDCWATCVEIPPGHRLRLEISSSAFGKYDVNLNGGGRIGHESEPVVAEQLVYHDAIHPSRLMLPILPRQ